MQHAWKKCLESKIYARSSLFPLYRGTTLRFLTQEACTSIAASGGALALYWWQEVKDMRELFEMDARNYDPEGTVYVRPSARCIAIREEKSP